MIGLAECIFIGVSKRVRSVSNIHGKEFHDISTFAAACASFYSRSDGTENGYNKY